MDHEPKANFAVPAIVIAVFAAGLALALNYGRYPAEVGPGEPQHPKAAETPAHTTGH